VDLVETHVKDAGRSSETNAAERGEKKHGQKLHLDEVSE
jgi:hypothetical protein